MPIKRRRRPEEKREENPKEVEAAVDTAGVLEDRHLAVGRRRQLKKGTQGDAESRQKLAVVPFLHCTRDVVVGVVAGHPAAGSGALDYRLIILDRYPSNATFGTQSCHLCVWRAESDSVRV
jgi:hypothetical protein